MGIKVTFSCDHQDGRADLYQDGRCGWADDSFGYAAAGDVELAKAIAALAAKGWDTTGPRLLCPEHNPARDPNPATEISVQVPAKVGPG